jgi:hypothetical protein
MQNYADALASFKTTPDRAVELRSRARWLLAWRQAARAGRFSHARPPPDQMPAFLPHDDDASVVELVDNRRFGAGDGNYFTRRYVQVLDRRHSNFDPFSKAGR